MESQGRPRPGDRGLFRAIRLGPKFGHAYNNRGSAWGAKGDLDRAIADFIQAIRLDPKDAQAYYNRGIAWEKQRSLREALAHFKMTLNSLHPTQMA